MESIDQKDIVDAAIARQEKIKVSKPVMNPLIVAAPAIAKCKTMRESKRLAAKHYVEFDAYCTSLIKLFFAFIKDNREPEAQKQYVIGLDKKWKEWLRINTRRFDYSVSQDFFATMLNYYMGNKEENEKLLSQITKS